MWSWFMLQYKLIIYFSPSLFHRPNTPQLSSTQFEWTIDEVSSLKPANVEPHETQFQDSPDPDLEARAQLAISSYFKEQQVVPSPIDCPLRSQRIILSEINGNTPLSKPGRRIRDCGSQTELTLPPILPSALEEALKPYFKPKLAGGDHEPNELDVCKSNQFKDVSLRRKLFDMHNIVVLDNESLKTPQHQTPKTSNSSTHSNSSPISLNSIQHTAIIGKLSDSLDKSSFGSLSPISSDSLSPNCITASATKRKTRFGSFLSEVDVELLSPIHPPSRRSPLKESNRSQYRDRDNDLSKTALVEINASTATDTNVRFTPERSSSPFNVMNKNNIADFSTDSFNLKVSRLKVNTSKAHLSGQEKLDNSDNKTQMETYIFQSDDTEEMFESTVDMDEAQVSELSAHSSNCSSSQSDTPKCKRRSASRKNLSQSFSANFLEDEDEQQLENAQSIKFKEIFANKQFSANFANKTATLFDDVNNQMEVTTTPKKNLAFYRTDSGFNEMSQNSLSSCDAAKLQDAQQLALMQQDILVCCSTPSKKFDFNFMS